MPATAQIVMNFLIVIFPLGPFSDPDRLSCRGHCVPSRTETLCLRKDRILQAENSHNASTPFPFISSSAARSCLRLVRPTLILPQWPSFAGVDRQLPACPSSGRFLSDGMPAAAPSDPSRKDSPRSLATWPRRPGITGPLAPRRALSLRWKPGPVWSRRWRAGQEKEHTSERDSPFPSFAKPVAQTDIGCPRPLDLLLQSQPKANRLPYRDTTLLPKVRQP